MVNVWIVISIVVVQFFTGTASSSPNQDQNNIDDLDTADAILLSQSGTCTEKDDSDRIQCFRELPLQSYEIFEGEDVMISCRVAHQQGKLQWAFKGKMLGFDRGIPTHSRMRMPGNAAIGDHSLFIENVKVSDSGNYECQLSPAASHPPRRRLTKLTVLKPPSPPIIYQNGKLNKYNISVSIRKEELDSYINLTCVSFDGNPAPTFLWSVNDVPLQSGSKFRSVNVLIKPINNNISFLSIKSTQILNGDMIKCAVSNAATQKMVNLSDKSLSTQVRVFKRMLPGKIFIKEVTDKTIVVTEGSRLQLSCVCSNPGDPPIDLKWHISEDEGSINHEWVASIKNDMISQTTLKIPNITRKWHKKSLYCSGTQDDYPAAKPQLVLILVHHPPSKINLEAISLRTNSTLHNPSTVYCKEGQVVKLSCTSDSYFTENVRIIWYVKNSEESDWQIASTPHEKVIIDPDGRMKYIKSTLDISPAFINKDISSHILSRLLLQVVCIMKSVKYNLEVRQQVKLELFEQPSIPTITMNDQTKPPILTNGESVKLKCSVTGGHPTPQLYLLDEKDQEIRTSSYYQIGMTKLEYSIEVKPRDNGKKFRCVVFYKNVMDFLPLSSDLMILKVAKPPEQLHMRIPPNSENLRANQLVSFQCFTDASFPEAKIEWWWHHSCKNPYLLVDRSSSQDVRSTCQSEVLSDQQNIVYQPMTQSNLSSITIKLTPEFDLSFIECLVVPHEKWTTFKGLLSRVTKLRVQYSPVFRDRKNSLLDTSMFTVEEGQNFSMSIKSQAHPSINGYTWLINKQPIERKSQIDLSVDRFSLTNAQPEMMANYTLLVENSLGKASFEFFLNITFAPKLLGPSVETLKANPLIEYKRKAVIMCSAQANPFRERSTVRWVREPAKVLDQVELLNMIMGRKLFTHSNSIHCSKDHWTEGNVSVNCISLGNVEIVSSLQILSTDYRYIGSYQCIFSNSIKPSSAIKTTKFVFPTAPVPIRNGRRSEFSANMADKSELSCYFVGFPIPSIRWLISYKNGSTDNPLKYSTSIVQLQTGLIKAALTIIETNELDLGRYKCIATNEYGESLHSVILDRPRTPTPPMNFTVINITDTNISVGWILGFNGGSKQIIQLQWRLRDMDPQTEYTIVEIPEEDDTDIQFYTITNLYREREYEISIQAINRYSTSAGTPKSMIIKTINYDSDLNVIQNDSKKGYNKMSETKLEKTDTNNFLIIVLLATVGILLLSLKIGLIVYFIRKRKLKQRQSREKMLSPATQQMIDTMGYLSNEDSMEMRAPSLVRSGIESNMYAQSLSDHLSQNGSDTGLKLNYYKTNSDDQFQSPYLGPELDLVASVMGRNHLDINALPSNFHPAYIQLAESSSMTGTQEPYIAGYFTQRPYYQQTPSRVAIRKSSQFSIDPTALPQYPISSTYQRRMDKIPYPQSAVSVSTNSGESNCSQSPPRKYVGYSPLINQSAATSTVEEYLSSGNSASESHKFGINGSDEYFSPNLSSFRIGQTSESLNPKDYYSPNSPSHQQNQESSLESQIQRVVCDKGMPASPYRIYSENRRLSASSDNEHLLKPPLDFSGVEPINTSDVQSPFTDSHKLNYVDLISHSSPSVIKFSGPIAEHL